MDIVSDVRAEDGSLAAGLVAMALAVGVVVGNAASVAVVS